MNASFRFAALTVIVLAACRGDAPSARMRDIAARGGRTVEARLTGFAWSPMRVQRGAPALDPARLELAGAAGAVIEKNPSGRDAGIGYLIIDRDSEAVEALQQAAQSSPNDAKIWSDLAAARYTLAARGDKPYELPRALAAADHALRIDPSLPDALFNRALIIERLGISEAARRAWQRYLQADGTSKWADEALAHLGRLDVINTRAQFERELALARAALVAGNSAPVAALARTHPQDARKWGEGPLLAEWADAFRAHDTARAKAALDTAREIGRALADSNHEYLLADSVAAIDRADAAQVATLADGHVAYRDGRIIYSQRRIADAQQLLRRAVELFHAGRSPMALSARYYAANTLYDDNRAGEAMPVLQQLLGDFDTTRYRALYAHGEWELALCQMALGTWEAAIHSLDAASRTFAALGETDNRGHTDSLLADAYDHAAQPRAAWAVRVRAFAELGNTQPDRINAELAAAVRPATARQQYDVALALSDLVLDVHGQGDAIALAVANVYRVRLLADSDNAASAPEAIARARTAVAAISDVAIRQRVSVLLDVARATAARDSDPAASIAMLDSALQFLTAHNEHAHLPDVYLQRGRAHVRLGDDNAALVDFENGLRELDGLRSAFQKAQLRSDFYDTDSELFTETIALLLRRGDTSRAFATADGARARTLTEQLTTATTSAISLQSVGRSLSADSMLLEYLVLRDRVAIFYASQSANGVEIVPADTAALRASIDHLSDLIQRRGDPGAIQTEAAALHHTLIEPVAAHLRGINRLIVVPDRDLNALPFAALYDRTSKRYLIESQMVSMAPSAAYLARAAAPRALAPMLVIGDPATDGGAALPEAAHEAQLIASMYPAATLLTGDRATRARFLQVAADSAMIHYAGHAESEAALPQGTLRLAADDPKTPGDLDADEIAHTRLRRSPLVVLAACGTIRGDANHVEGMDSLARAFLAAGARGVIGTLWDVEDTTSARLFRRLHQELRTGADPVAALRDTQLEFLRSGDAHLQHPASWAAIEILGQDD